MFEALSTKRHRLSLMHLLGSKYQFQNINLIVQYITQILPSSDNCKWKGGDSSSNPPLLGQSQILKYRSNSKDFSHQARMPLKKGNCVSSFAKSSWSKVEFFLNLTFYFHFTSSLCILYYFILFFLFRQKDIPHIVNKDPYNDIKEALIRIKKKQGLWKGLIQQISHSIEGTCQFLISLKW